MDAVIITGTTVLDRSGRRHRPDHPQRLAQAGRAAPASTRASSRSGARPGLRGTRSSSRAPTSWIAGSELRQAGSSHQHVGHPAVRVRRGGLATVRRHLPATTRPRTAWFRCRCLPRSAASCSDGRSGPGPAVRDRHRAADPGVRFAGPGRGLPARRLGAAPLPPEGLDDIGLSLRHDADITTFEAQRPAWMPTA